LNAAYKISLFLFILSILSQTSFFLMAFYQTGAKGVSWIIYHPEDWIISLYLSALAIASFLAGAAQEKQVRVALFTIFCASFIAFFYWAVYFEMVLWGKNFTEAINLSWWNWLGMAITLMVMIYLALHWKQKKIKEIEGAADRRRHGIA
jgi:hypothetical protein